jgi:hypothetical protein
MRKVIGIIQKNLYSSPVSTNSHSKKTNADDTNDDDDDGDVDDDALVTA